MTRSSALSQPTQSDAHTLADWAEALMEIEQRQVLSRSTLRTRLRDVLSHDETELDLLFSEVRRRSAASATIYPYTVDATRIVRSGTDGTVYCYLLLLALEEAPFRKAGKFARVEFGLDLLAVAALKAYLGDAALGVRFAWPPGKGPGRRPTRFPEAVSWLADQLNLPTGSGRRSPSKKDGGVDVVVWRPFHDRAGAFLVILAQTTVTRTFVPKAKDISRDQWKDWISFGSSPITALVVPHSIPTNSDAWDDMHYDVNLILDRVRLCELLEEAEPIEHALHADIATWCSSQLDALIL